MRTGSRFLIASAVAGLLLSSALAADDAAQAAGRPVTRRQAVMKVSRLPGVHRAEYVGETAKAFKVSSFENGGQIRVRWIRKETGSRGGVRIDRTTRDLMHAALARVAAENPTGTVIAGDATGRGMPLLTSSAGDYIRIGVKNGTVTDQKGTREVDRNVLVSIRGGHVGPTREDPQNDVDHGGPVFGPIKR